MEANILFFVFSKSNKAFVERVSSFKEAIEILEQCGFTDTGGFRVSGWRV